MTLRILFIHNNFPGQYARIVTRLKNRSGFELLSGCLKTNRQKPLVKQIRYHPHREARKDIHPALRYTESAVIRAQAVYKAFKPLQNKGWSPDVVLAHSGFGDGLFVKDLWPDTKYMPYFEWFYRAYGSDASFLNHEARKSPDEEINIRLKNTAILHDLAAMDWGQCPTDYQKSQFPDQFKERISVLHDGIDTDYFSPQDGAVFVHGDHTFHHGDPIITYVARGFEPYRGFPQFIEALSILQRQNPLVQAIIIGEDRTAYGAKRKDGKTHKQWALETFQIDPSRVHFLGRQPLKVLQAVFRVSAAHVYLTVPFVLSWSMMEAMSTGALIIGSDTAPVREMIAEGKTGLLVPFFDANQLAARLNEAVCNQHKYLPLRRQARQLIVERYGIEASTSRYQRLIENVAAAKPAPGAGIALL